MNTTERKDYQNELYEIARNTKDALFAEWEASDSEKKYFKDKHEANKMNKRGLLPEGIGTTSLLLMLAAFGESIFSKDDLKKCDKIINTAMINIRDWSKGGYMPTPILSTDNIRKAFDESAGYVDTVTWCLSSAILARYNQKKNLLHLEKNVESYIFDAIAKGILTLCEAQKGGLWGFRADNISPRSLYYTYSASASVADFFDYILGEIALLDLPAGATEMEQEQAINQAIDTEVIDYINEYIKNNNLDFEIQDRVKASRDSLRHWLIYDALPLFPQLASCDSLSDSARNTLGIGWDPSREKQADPDKPIKMDETTLKYFYHLYYAFYLLDMMVTAGADSHFEEIIKDVDKVKDLAKYYEEKKSLSEKDLLYYFGNRKFNERDIQRGDYHYAELFDKTVEYALYTARSQYTNASKTGNAFWNYAELPIVIWHPNAAINDAVGKFKPIDPSVIAMALRANITYSYYVTETPDIAIERLFDEMCSDIYSEKYRETLDDFELADKDSECVINLWDRTNYSLSLTERAVEALVDFKDYLEKFYNEPTPAINQAEAPRTETKIKCITEPSALDKAVEAKIAEYLQSDAGKKLIENELAKCKPLAAVSAAADSPSSIDIEAITKFIKLLNSQNRTKPDPEGDEYDVLMGALETLMSKVMQCSIYRIVREGIPRKDRDTEDANEKISRAAPEIYQQLLGLLVAMSNNENLDYPDNKLDFFYGKLPNLK
jgi:hypothetical protein